MQVFTASCFSGIIYINGIDSNTGQMFTREVLVDETCPEFVSFVNELGARKASELL